jgi:hypothetical protein
MSKKFPPPKTDEEAYQRLLSPQFYGYKKVEIAKFVGLPKQSLTRWKSVPVNYVTRLHEATGIPKEHLRPSDFA